MFKFPFCFLFQAERHAWLLCSIVVWRRMYNSTSSTHGWCPEKVVIFQILKIAWAAWAKFQSFKVWSFPPGETYPKFQSFKVFSVIWDIQNFKVSKFCAWPPGRHIQSFTVSKVFQSFKVFKVFKSFKVSKFQSFVEAPNTVANPCGVAGWFLDGL